MNIADVTRGERGFTIRWDDESVAEFPFIWLRDNDPEEFHPDTRERVFDLTSVDLEICPRSYDQNGASLSVRWPENNEPSVYAVDWLFRHRPGQVREDPSVVEQSLWDAESMHKIPRVSSADCAADPEVLKEALLTLKRFGILIIEGLEDSVDASHSFSELVGFERQTNFGVDFEVINIPEPHNLAYTPLALPLHTDLPNQEQIPGYQFLHAYRNSTTGGESVFADGFRICADLQEESPRDLALLKRIPIPWRFHDRYNDIRQHRPIIAQRDDGSFDYIVFNAHIADLPDMDTETLYEFYRAYQRLMIRIRSPKYAIQYAIAPGEMVAFDNSRVLHGRKAFDPASGERHYRGYYLERNEVDSRIRVLSRS